MTMVESYGSSFKLYFSSKFQKPINEYVVKSAKLYI